MQYILAALSSALLVAAWFHPGSILCALLGWIACLLLLISVRRTANGYPASILAGMITYAGGFYWLAHTIQYFGGFGLAPTAGIFTLFVTLSSLQYPIFVLLYRNAPRVLNRLGLSAATAWVLSEYFSIRIFPWFWGHTQLGFSYFAQIADIAGAQLISFVMFWVCEATLRLVGRERNRVLFVPYAVLALSITYGAAIIDRLESTEWPEQPIAMVQANIALEEKMDRQTFIRNIEKHVALSSAESTRGHLIIWPETAIMEWISSEVGSVSRDYRLPYLGKDRPMLVGSLSYSPPENMHNSAIAIMSDGRVPRPYNKIVLMPFGEFTPLGNIFPFLKEINSTAGDFLAGEEPVVFEYRLADGDGRERVLLASPLICYEDVTPQLARKAVLAGANLLVNLTNDAWFGNTAAPHQHHLIASFRAIENRRYLARSTNTGLTALVDATGRTIAQAPVFSEQTLLAKARLISYKSPYTQFAGDRPYWILLVVYMALAVFSRVPGTTRGQR